MTTPADSDWINAARHIWNADHEGDVWVPNANDASCTAGFSTDILGQPDYEAGAWVQGARVWISREQLDAYLSLQAGNGDGPHLPIIIYEPPAYFNAPATAGEQS